MINYQLAALAIAALGVVVLALVVLVGVLFHRVAKTQGLLDSLVRLLGLAGGDQQATAEPTLAEDAAELRTITSGFAPPRGGSGFQAPDPTRPAPTPEGMRTGRVRPPHPGGGHQPRRKEST